MPLTHRPFENDQEVIDRLNAGVRGLQALLQAVDNIRSNYIDEAEDDAIVEDFNNPRALPAPYREIWGWTEIDAALEAVKTFRELSNLDVSVDFLGRESYDDECGLSCLVYVQNGGDA